MSRRLEEDTQEGLEGLRRHMDTKLAASSLQMDDLEARILLEAGQGRRLEESLGGLVSAMEELRQRVEGGLAEERRRLAEVERLADARAAAVGGQAEAAAQRAEEGLRGLEEMGRRLESALAGRGRLQEAAEASAARQRLEERVEALVAAAKVGCFPVLLYLRCGERTGWQGFCGVYMGMGERRAKR